MEITSTHHGQPEYIWNSEPGQLFRSQFVLYRPVSGEMKQTLAGLAGATRLTRFDFRLNLHLLKSQRCVPSPFLYLLLPLLLLLLLLLPKFVTVQNYGFLDEKAFAKKFRGNGAIKRCKRKQSLRAIARKSDQQNSDWKP